MFLTGKPAFFKTFIRWLDYEHEKAVSALHACDDLPDIDQRIAARFPFEGRIANISLVREFVAEYLKVGK